MDNPARPGPPLDTPPLQRGDFVTLTTDTGRTLDAFVALASPNGRSLILMFDGMVGGWAGHIPAFQDDDRSWHTLDRMPLTLVRRQGGAG